MKNLILTHVIRMSKLFTYAFLFQCLTMGLLFASNGNAQIKSIEEVIVRMPLEGVSVKDAFKKIEGASDFTFVYLTREVRNLPPIFVEGKGQSLYDVLVEIAQQTGLDFKQINHNIHVQKSNKEENEPMISISEVDVVVRGTVTDEKGEPLPGATLLVEGTNIGTVTDIDGNFTLDVPERGVLIFSFIGYETKRVTVGDQSVINVMLKETSSSLSEFVVVGYGTQRKANLTGAVDQISSEMLENRPITNVARGLQGIVPNLNITNSGGNPNSNPGINIRGTATISGSGEPLVLVDGVQMDMNLLNPSDIESITVLKDAASSAIYGARGAFGVILITLKEGIREGKPVININSGIEFNQPTYLPDMLSTMEYMEATNIARQRRFGTILFSDQQIGWLQARIDDPVNNPNYHIQPNGNIFWHENVDNFGEMLQDWAPAQNHNVSIRGGTEKLSYFGSVGYRNQEGMFNDATDIFNRYNFLMNVNASVTDWLKIGFKTTYSNKIYNEPHRYTGKGSSWWEQMRRGAPQILFPIRTPSDSPIPNAPTEHFHNFLTAGGRRITQTEMGMYSINAEIDLAKGLKFNGDFNYQSINENISDNKRRFGFVRDRFQLQYNQTEPSFLERQNMDADYFAANAYLTYDKIFGEDHNFSGMVGYNQEWDERLTFYVRAQELVSEEVPSIGLATGEIFTNDNYQDWAIRGVFGRFSYNYKQKYIVEVNGRYDGTSRFPTDSRFKFFPSFSAGWRIGDEPFMDATKSFLSDLKVRGSYGSLGNQSVAGLYPYIANFNLVNPVNYLINSGLPLGLTPPGLVDPSLTWETSTTIDFGFDMTLFDKLDINFDWYKRTTRDMLIAGERLPAVLGAGSPNRNGGELETIGGELSIKWRDQTPYGLNYNVGLVLSDYMTTITKFENNPNNLITTYYAGQQIGEIWGFETVGFFQNQEQIDGAANHLQLAGVARTPGDIEYRDLNGDGVINYGNNTLENPGDQRIIGNSTPRYQYGLMGDLNWKNFDLRLFFQGIGFREVYPTGLYFWGQIQGAGAVGTREVYYNSWNEDNTNAYYPIYKQNSAFNSLSQTRYLQNAAYTRLKNLTFGYTIPSSATERINVQKLRVYFSGENLWEINRLRGNFDPEVIRSEEGQEGNFGQFYPLQRTLSFGIQIVI